MSLPILALFARSLRAGTRSASTYWWRGGVAGLMLFALLSAQSGGTRVAAVGLRLFSALARVNFLFITLAGVLHFSAAIAEEKEQETLGLLRMTGLGPLAILLGKAGSSLINAAMLLLAQVPFAMLAVTLGGVSATQILGAYATLLAYMVLLSAMALTCSVAERTVHGATWLAGILIGAFLLTGAVASGLLHTPP